MVLIVFTAIVFSVLHRDFSPDGFVSHVLMGVGFAYMTLRLGGIEFSAGAHAANNILVVLFVEPLTLGASDAGAGLSLTTLAGDAAIFAGYILIAEMVARLPQLRSTNTGISALVLPDGEISAFGIRSRRQLTSLHDRRSGSRFCVGPRRGVPSWPLANRA